MAAPCKNEFHLIPDEAQIAVDKLGSDVTVPCQLLPEISAVDMEIRWFKETECVCLYIEKKMIPGMVYKGRVGLNKELEKGNVSLELKDVGESDGGDYLCQVTSGDRTEEKTVRLSLKTHEVTDTLQKTIEKTAPEQTDEKKMEKSALMAVFTELKDTSESLENAKQDIKEKDAEIQDLKTKLLQTDKEPEKENTQLENKQKTAKELETSTFKQDNLETKTTPQEKQQLDIDPVQGQDQVRSQKSKKDQGGSESMETKKQRKTSEPSETKDVKVFTFYTGNKKALHEVHKNFIGTLRNQIPNLREVETVDESDFTLILCLAVSRAGTDIDAALKQFEGNTGSKLAVLVVLHPTIDPEKVVLDSSKYVNRTDILTVDYLLNEDTGLLKCQRNSDADDKVKNWLKQVFNKVIHKNLKTAQKYQDQGKPHKSKKDKSESETVQTKRLKREDDKPKTKGVKVFVILAGKTNQCEQEFIAILRTQTKNLSEVCTVDKSDIILVFCPIVSRIGTDIEAALNKLKCCTDSEHTQKPTVLVVLHHTFDPEKMVLDSSKYVSRTDILTVDTLFYEDTGLLKCQKNSESTDKVVNWLIQQEKKHEASGVNMQQVTSTFSHPVNYFLNVTGDAQEHHMHFIEALRKNINLRKVSTVQESDVILLFCPDISGCHKRTDRPVVLISLHQTLDPDNSKRRAVIPVDYIFLEGEGHFDYQMNKDEISAVLRNLKEKKEQPSVNRHPSPPVSPVFTSSQPVSYFTNLTGDAKERFIDATKNQICLNEVSSVENSDVILLFCPDISDCNKRRDRPVVLISLHKTLPSDSVPSSNEFVNRRDILPLDLVFVEGEGLPDCKINQYELSAFLKLLSTKIIKDK